MTTNNTNNIIFEESDIIITVEIDFDNRLTKIGNRTYTEEELTKKPTPEPKSEELVQSPIPEPPTMTKEEWIKLLKHDGCFLKDVTIDLDNELVNTAITSNGICLKDVPLEYINLALCEKAMDSNFRALQYIPSVYKQQLSGTTIDRALINCPWMLEYVEDKQKYFDLVTREPGLMKYFRSGPYDSHKVLQAVTKNNFIIKYIDGEYVDLKMVKVLASMSGETFVDFIQNKEIKELLALFANSK